MNAITPLADISLGTYHHIDTDYDASRKALWCRMNATGRACFTPELLNELAAFQKQVQLCANPSLPDRDMPTDYLVVASKAPDIYSFGGDLELFSELIGNGDRDRLSEYVRHSINILYQNAVNYHLPIRTIALLQGDAIGAGFETALSCDVIVAESNVSMGFPEILFNLFPGMGAHSFISRRLDLCTAERMIRTGKLYTAEEMHELGLVDVLAEPGKGEQALNDYIDTNSRRRHVYDALFSVRQVVNPLSLDELMKIGEIWVDAAMTLGQRELRVMQRLMRAQNRKLATRSAA
ncbi:MAG: crotonase/enoyl-CoA hydratase family protein [Granulosicoccaceae bacterium]|jgi:DSF synthase